MNSVVCVAYSNNNNHIRIEGVFSNEEYAQQFCDLENSKVEDFRREDEGYTYDMYRLDDKRVPDNQRYKSYWDYKIIIDKDVQEYGSIEYVNSGKELVYINKTQDVEFYDNEFIYCRSYVSKQEAENIAKETWQIYEQRQLVKNT